MNGTRWVYGVLGATLLGAAGLVGAADVSQAPVSKIMVFYPGTSGMEWILTGTEHGGAKGVKRGEPCISCHIDVKAKSDESAEIGEKIAAGEKTKSAALEPNPIKGKPGSIPVMMQAAHDGANLYLRFTWKDTKFSSGNKMDPDHPIKLAFMLEEPGKNEMDSTGGCWATCHTDVRTMPGVKDATKTKYVKGGNLAAGKFFDINQYRSGKGGMMIDGHIADKRVMEGGKALSEAKGELKDGMWTVTFVRKFAGGEGDVKIEPGKAYNFGIAIHDDYTEGRYHYVSFGYTLGIDAKADIDISKL
ncbi:MAG: hypothetical protein KGZ83_12530 [Sulfuricella sp.]|nr:hypothetical protein [Sulfuricella sp.]